MLGFARKLSNLSYPTMPKPAMKMPQNVRKVRHPARYFDFKEFRKALSEKKERLKLAEKREFERSFCEPPPFAGEHPVQEFLTQIGFDPALSEQLARLFQTWIDFASRNPKDLELITELTSAQRAKINRYLILWRRGLWPNQSFADLKSKFGGKTEYLEGWNPELDAELLRLSDLYDVSFGDPWLYISYELDKRPADVKDRYITLKMRPKLSEVTCDFEITKASRPLLMNRYFPIMPPTLYVVPSNSSHSLEKTPTKLPAAFGKYRDDEVFEDA